MKRIFLAFFLLILINTLKSQTYTKGVINENTIWTVSKSPYIITDLVTIDSNVTLTIEPGSMVIFEDYNSKIVGKGKIVSTGVTYKTYYHKSSKHGDSIYSQEVDKYFSPSDYKIFKENYDKINYETTFMPGIGYTFFQPKASDSIGLFTGIAVEYLIFAKVSQNDKRGPSHIRFYTKLNILNSNKKDINSMFSYALGLDLSIEKNPKRSFLIPYFGLEFGGLSQKKFGTCIQFIPTLGIHILSKKNIFINLHTGYVYPVSNFEMLQGWFGQAGINFALW